MTDSNRLTPRLQLVAWEITRSCNLHCAHCYTDSHDVAYEDGLAEDHRVDCDGGRSSVGDGRREDSARNIHLPEKPAAEDVAVRVRVGRHAGGANGQRSARLATVRICRGRLRIALH